MTASNPNISSIEEIIADFAEGKMVLIIDDENRENEGDLFIAAEKVLPEHINFMAMNGRGLICLTLTSQKCEQLRLPLMVSNSVVDTAFTISIEAAHGITTGISASDRATTVRVAVNKNAVPKDIAMPGHIFPLMAKDGGVLIRPGHTEAGCDLARLAGFEPSAVIVEVMKEDGNMARLSDLIEFSKKHDIKIGMIADLIRYRIVREKNIERVSSCSLPTQFGDFELIGYQNSITKNVHFVLIYGKLDVSASVLTRVHMFNVLNDAFQSTCDKNIWNLSSAMRQIAEHGSGIIVVLCHNGMDVNLLEEIESYRQQIHSAKTTKTWDSKLYGEGAQIIADLGIRKIKLISTKFEFVALDGFDIKIEEYVDKM